MQIFPASVWLSHYNVLLATFWTNPQFRITVTDADENDDEDVGTMIVGLMQKNMRSRGLSFNTIGYMIYKVNIISDSNYVNQQLFFVLF